jgi:phosphoglucosamine mutase
MSLRFGTDGIRGVANRDLTPEIALALGRSSARYLPGESFFVGSDTRRSSPMLKAALVAGLASEGRRVFDLGVLPTPALAWIVASKGVPGAIVSASHNPFPDNGIKLISENGTKLSDELETEIESHLSRALLDGSAASHETRVGDGVGEVIDARDLVAEYVEHLARAVDLPSEVGLRVICDCGNGAAYEVAPAVLARLGVEAFVINDAPNGTNINAGCGATAPAQLAGVVVERGADLGLSFDGDADRMIAVDEHGNVVDGDVLMALFALDLKARGELDKDGMVATVMSNLGLRRAMNLAGIDLIETPVGDRYVADALDELGLILGGEQSGHIVFRAYATTGDGVLTGIKLIELVARSKRRLSDLAAGALVRVPQQLRSVKVLAPDRLESAADVWQAVRAVESELGDAGRVVVRSSGTESAVRVMVEADDVNTVERALATIVDAVERDLGTYSG